MDYIGNEIFSFFPYPNRSPEITLKIIAFLSVSILLFDIFQSILTNLIKKFDIKDE
jgi:hypothetical protein